MAQHPAHTQYIFVEHPLRAQTGGNVARIRSNFAGLIAPFDIPHQRFHQGCQQTEAKIPYPADGQLRLLAFAFLFIIPGALNMRPGMPTPPLPF